MKLSTSRFAPKFTPPSGATTVILALVGTAALYVVATHGYAVDVRWSTGGVHVAPAPASIPSASATPSPRLGAQAQRPAE